MWQLDVQAAFLQSKIEGRNVYAKTARGQEVKDLKTGEPMVYKLTRSLYGLAQSPVLWNDTTNAAMLTVGLTPTPSDPCVYTYEEDDTPVILSLYVDDILITGNDEKIVKQLKKALTNRFAMTDMGEVSLIFGMKVTRDYKQGTLSISQVDYVNSILERFGMKDCNPVHTPGYGSEISSEQPESSLLDTTGTKLYQAKSMLNLTQCTRYDISHAVNQLTQACSKPARAHMTASKHALKVPQGTPGLAHHLQARTVSDARILRRQLCKQPGISQIDDMIRFFRVRRTCKLRSDDAVAYCTIHCGGRTDGHQLHLKRGGVSV